MILLDPRVTKLADGYARIGQFMETMRGEWLPGFERSYTRRSQEYQQALAKYEKRGFFMRTLLRKPKKPQRLPGNYVADVEERLWQGWRAAIAAQDAPNHNALLDSLGPVLDERFLVIRNVRLADEVTVGLVVCGPPGVMLLEATEENRAKEIIQQLAAGTVVAEAPIISGAGADRAAAAIAQRPAVEPQHIYLLADVILQRHQSLTTGKWVSAAQAAEKATERERFNLLKQAATL